MASRRYSAIGIDIGADALKMVQFCSRSGGRNLVAARRVEAPLPAGDEPGDAAAATKTLRRALASAGFKPGRAVVTLPAADVAVRPLTLPAGKKDVAEMVRAEAAGFLDCSPDEALLDHVVLGEAKAAGERHLEVLAAAVRKDQALRMLDVLARAGVVAEAVDIAPLALCRLLLAVVGNTDGAAAAVDIGAHATHAIVMDKRELRMSRLIELGGDTFTQAIAAGLEIAPAEAEALKRQHGAGLDGRSAPGTDGAEAVKIASIIHDILRDPIGSLASELSRLLRYFAAQNQGRRVERVVLFGGGASLKHLDTILAEQLGIEVSVGAPIRQITGDAAEADGGNEGAFAVAAGLALRDV
jgi:type IV pilus assembly protein PilM